MTPPPRTKVLASLSQHALLEIQIAGMLLATIAQRKAMEEITDEDLRACGTLATRLINVLTGA